MYKVRKIADELSVSPALCLQDLADNSHVSHIDQLNDSARQHARRILPEKWEAISLHSKDTLCLRSDVER